MEVSPVALVPGRTDAEIADEIRRELRPALEEVASVFMMARRHGLNVGFAIEWDSFGRAVIGSINVTKPL